MPGSTFWVSNLVGLGYNLGIKVVKSTSEAFVLIKIRNQKGSRESKKYWR